MTTGRSDGRETPSQVYRAPEAQAKAFASVRQARKNEMAEDCVRLIDELIEANGEARLVEIAKRLGMEPPKVTRNISLLETAGLVRREKYRAIFLTNEGQTLAKACRRRLRIVVEFLRSLGIDEETAERDAEGIEHHVSDETLSAFASKVGHAKRAL